MKSGSRKDDFAARILRAKGNPDELDKILQDQCRRRAAKKLAATLSLSPGFRFPTALSAEQCTADDVAAFHASLIAGAATPPRVVDLTCGLGIDAFHIARSAGSVTCIDVNPAVAAAIGPNAKSLGLDNVTAICANSEEWLTQYPGPQLDIAFIDPARRASDGSRLYSLRQCQPDIIGLLPRIAEIAGRVLLKASPMLDISRSIDELGDVTAVYAVGTRTECKELLFDIRFGFEGEPQIYAVTVGDRVEMLPQRREKTDCVQQLNIGDIIGEPWPAVMKIMPCSIAGSAQLQPSTFLFHNPAESFPGNLYRIERIEEFSSSNLRKLSREGIQASVAARNFPLSADELRRRLKAKESSSLRLMATTLWGGKEILLFLSPVSQKNS